MNVLFTSHDEGIEVSFSGMGMNGLARFTYKFIDGITLFD
jgi:hypothetical protein